MTKRAWYAYIAVGLVCVALQFLDVTIYGTRITLLAQLVFLVVIAYVLFRIYRDRPSRAARHR